MATAVEVGCRGCGCGLKRRGPEIWACGMGRGITAGITAMIREAVECECEEDGEGSDRRTRFVSGALVRWADASWERRAGQRC